MSSLARDQFDRLLGELSADEFAAFLADLWSARGWSTTVDGHVVTATREAPTAERQTLFIHRSTHRFRHVDRTDSRRDVTHVVTSGSGTRAREIAASRDAALVDTQELYDVVTYGLSADARESLFDRYFGSRATAPGGISRSIVDAVSGVRAGRTAIVGSAAAIVLFAAAVGGLSLFAASEPGLTGGPDEPIVTTPTPEPFEVPAGSPPVESTPTSASVEPATASGDDGTSGGCSWLRCAPEEPGESHVTTLTPAPADEPGGPPPDQHNRASTPDAGPDAWGAPNGSAGGCWAACAPEEGHRETDDGG